MENSEFKDFEIERVDEPGAEKTYYHQQSYEFTSSGKTPAPWKIKLIIAGLVLAGMVVGTILFLFFLTVFVYFFLPLTVLFLVWQAFRRWFR